METLPTKTTKYSEKQSNIKRGILQTMFFKNEKPCCKLVASTKTFKSNVVFHQLNCRAVIYLLGLLKCKLQYVGKWETQLNIKLDKQRKEVTTKDSIKNDFSIEGQDFKCHTKLIKHINSIKQILTNQRLENNWKSERITLS